MPEPLELEVLTPKTDSNIEFINVPPSNNIFNQVGQNDYTLDEALSEFIDNSISARLNNQVLVEIEFCID